MKTRSMRPRYGSYENVAESPKSWWIFPAAGVPVKRAPAVGFSMYGLSSGSTGKWVCPMAFFGRAGGHKTTPTGRVHAGLQAGGPIDLSDCKNDRGSLARISGPRALQF